MDALAEFLWLTSFAAIVISVADRLFIAYYTLLCYCPPTSNSNTLLFTGL